MFGLNPDSKMPILSGKAAQGWQGYRRLYCLTGQALLVISLTVVGAGCTELTVPPVVEKDFLIPPPDQGPAVQLNWKGEGLEDSEWIRSYTVYRIVFDDLENTSGSIRDLLEPGLIQSIHRSEMVLAEQSSLTEANLALYDKYGKSPADCNLSVEIMQRDISYFPRREFVQTPGGIRPGHIVTLFRYSYCMDSDCQEFQIERTTRTHTDEAPDRLETEAALILKQMEKDAYDFLSNRRSQCETAGKASSI